MALVFCCPECGATLRATRSAAVVVIGCIGCGVPVRVPKQGHPAEAAFDSPTIRLVDADRARHGLKRLQQSLWLFGLASLCALSLISLFSILGSRPAAPAPEWLQPTVGLLALVWLGVSWTGCYFRIRGYQACEAAAATVGVDGWTRIAAWGASLAAVGHFSIVVLFFTRTTPMMFPEVTAIATAGLLAGMAGTAFEFGFLTPIHRMLWESSGWQMAGHTSHYAITVIFTSVAAMGVIFAGFLTLSNLRAHDPEGLANASQFRTVIAGMASALAGLIVYVTLRYRRLLSTTRAALVPPVPIPQEKLPTP